MWTYILRRLLLMIPTLFGVTIVSFCIMQLAPGDPVQDPRGASGNSSSGQTSEAYLIQKRDLKLDKPLLINFHSFRDYSTQLLIVAHYLSLNPKQFEADLQELANVQKGEKSEAATRLAFLRTRRILDFEPRLADPSRRSELARTAIPRSMAAYCEDLGVYGVPTIMRLLDNPETTLQQKIGLVAALNNMVVNAFSYTYSRTPLESETPIVLATWKLWWDRVNKQFAPVDPDRRKVLVDTLSGAVNEAVENNVFGYLEKFNQEDAPFLYERLSGPDSSLKERAICAVALKLLFSEPVRLTLPVDASEADVNEVVANWKEHFAQHQDEYRPGIGRRMWEVVSDTQYAHMVWRLITFNFGRSSLRTREPVSEKIWDAVQISAPLMLLTEILIYGLAIPLGVICAVQRGRFLDRAISLKLFLLFSIPPFVAGMIFQLLFCTRDFMEWMPVVNRTIGTNFQPLPMYGLHSDQYADYWKNHGTAAADSSLTLIGYLGDYLWHAALPVICLSLFSLAGLAMYGRTSMLDVLGQDYVRTGRAKGLSEWTVIMKHALRNGLIPLITLFSSFLPALLGGSVLIEVLFNIPGMGRLSTTSIENKDVPTLMALIYIDAIVVMVSMLITDILYVVVDPRISYEAREG